MPEYYRLGIHIDNEAVVRTDICLQMSFQHLILAVIMALPDEDSYIYRKNGGKWKHTWHDCSTAYFLTILIHIVYKIELS